MANTSDIKNGMCLNHNNGLWNIVEFLHVKPGKGAAFVRTKLKNIETIQNGFNIFVLKKVMVRAKLSQPSLFKAEKYRNNSDALQ